MRNDRREDSAPDHQEVEWLTPAPDGSAVHLPWPDESGPFLLTCHLAHIDGRTQLVGLDVRSFSLDDEGNPVPGPQGLVEVNHPALRSLRAGEIAEAARACLAALLGAQSGSDSWDSYVRSAASRKFAALTSPDKPRPTGMRAASPHLERVAELFLQAIAAGGETARKPSLYVHRALVADGLDVSLSAVRGQIHRARGKGLIPPGRS